MAKEACSGLVDDTRRQNCTFDVALTGETGFAETYLQTQRLERQGTTTILSTEPKSRQNGTAQGFAAAVVPRWPTGDEVPTGTVQFSLHGEPAGEPVKLDGDGRATWVPKEFDWQSYEVNARYIPAKESAFLTSISEKASKSK